MLRVTFIIGSSLLASCGYLLWFAGLVPSTPNFAPTVLQRIVAILASLLLVIPLVSLVISVAGEEAYRRGPVAQRRLLRKILGGIASLMLVLGHFLGEIPAQQVEGPLLWLTTSSFAIFVVGASLFLVDGLHILKLSGRDPAGQNEPGDGPASVTH